MVYMEPLLLIGCSVHLNAVVGFIDEKGNRRHTGNVTRAVQIEPFPFAANFAPERIEA